MPETHSTETAIERRLAAVERAVSDDALAATENAANDATTDGQTPGERLDAAADRIDALERRVRELEAATEAMRGYVGAVRAVNRRVERRADAALAAVASLDPDDERDTDPSAVLAPDDSPPPDERGARETAAAADATDGSDTTATADAAAESSDTADDTVTAWWEEPTCPRLRERES